MAEPTEPEQIAIMKRLPHHGPYLGPVFAVLVALFGIALLVVLNMFRV